MRRGFLFTLDALLAVILIIGAIAMFIQLDSSSAVHTSPQTVAEDVLLSLDALPLKDLETAHPWIPSLYGTGLSGNDSVLYGMAYLWVINDSRRSILADLASSLTPPGMALTLSIEGSTTEVLLQETAPTTGRLKAVARQQVTGIDLGRPVAGSSSTAYLKKLRDKRTSAFAYFGGFVGQGNITVAIDLPSDVDSSRITSVDLELDTPQEFSLAINGAHCDTLTPTTATMRADRWDISYCNGSLAPGTNTVSLTYDDLNDAYVAGGFLKVSFTTDEFTAGDDLGETRYRFPEVTGIVNLYDAFIIPEMLNSLEIRLRYDLSEPNTTAYLSIGEKTVWSSNRTGLVDVTLDDTNLSMLDYAYLSRKTVPIRFSAFNYTTQVFTGGDADVVVVTDYSGSMKKEIAADGQGNIQPLDNCAAVYADSTVRRTHLARCLDKELVATLFNESANITGNRLWPVHYESDQVHRYDNPEDREALIGYYETVTPLFPQQGSGQTCIACALSEAYEVFQTNPGVNRSRFVILMSDGLATHCTDAGCSARSTGYGAEQCPGYCDVSGQNCGGSVAYCTDTTCDPAADNARIVAQQLKDDFNATIYTVGFGPVSTCSKASVLLDDIATIGNGTYQSSSDIDALRDIYRNISYTILDAILLDAQKANVSVVGGRSASTLHDESYILARHEEPTNPPRANEIEVTRQSEPFGTLPGGPCAPTVPLPSGVRFKQAEVVSYSGSNWTDIVTANGTTVHNLSNFLVRYSRLGDPYHINIPVEHLSNQTPLRVQTADDPSVPGGCSEDNSLVYTAYVPSATARTPVLEGAGGCHWTIQTDDGSVITPTVPGDYTGGADCYYQPGNIVYNASDAMQVAVVRLLGQLDFDGNGEIFVSLKEEDLEIIVTKVSSVPYLWGPIMLTAEVEQ